MLMLKNHSFIKLKMLKIKKIFLVLNLESELSKLKFRKFLNILNIMAN